MTADELYAQHTPPNFDQVVEIAEAYIAEQGDLPEAIWHSLGENQPTIDDSIVVWDALTALREAHFAELGEPMPPYVGNLI